MLKNLSHIIVSFNISQLPKLYLFFLVGSLNNHNDDANSKVDNKENNTLRMHHTSLYISLNSTAGLRREIS